jgi:small GTP-binding protein
VHYTTAKIALVGDSGVGKTGLGWRITHGEFKEQTSTHGQQFWVVGELGTTRADGTECEAVLWDYGGQPDYRIIHSLFLDDVNLSLILFDPSRRENPLSGVEFWLKQLSHRRNSPCTSILVGARIDRGTSTLTQEELEEFCRQSGIMGGYISTSALQGVGLPELMEKIKIQIPWDEMPATITTATFKRVKEYVLSLKESSEHKEVLVSPGALRQRLEQLDPNWQFSDDEMMTAVRHLQTHGYVRVLRSSFGGESILLFPDLLINMASSFVLEARKHPRGFGVLVEDTLLRGGYRFPELDGLTEEEQKTLLDAATALFLGRNLCFRETFSEQTLLAFPSLINEKRPRSEEAEILEDVSYRVSGAVENVYATLVVLLGYTNTFIRTNQWQNQAQYQLGANEVCGFRQATEHEGEIELVLYYGTKTPEDVRLLFQGMFERFLRRREVSVVRYPPVVCPQCDTRQQRAVVMEQIQRGRSSFFCPECGHEIPIPKIDVIIGLSGHARDMIDQEQAVATRRTAFETALVRVKSILREQGQAARAPSCFISYAWGVPEHETWALTLAKDLRNAGIDVIFDRSNRPGTSITRFIEKIDSSDYVVSVGTSGYLEKYNAMQVDPVVEAEIRLINTLLRKKHQREKVIPLLLYGEQQTSFPPLFQDSVYIDFRNEELYFVHLFDLLLTLYEIPFDHPAIEDERESMQVEASGRRGARLQEERQV